MNEREQLIAMLKRAGIVHETGRDGDGYVVFVWAGDPADDLSTRWFFDESGDLQDVDEC